MNVLMGYPRINESNNLTTCSGSHTYGRWILGIKMLSLILSKMSIMRAPKYFCVVMRVINRVIQIDAFTGTDLLSNSERSRLMLVTAQSGSCVKGLVT